MKRSRAPLIVAVALLFLAGIVEVRGSLEGKFIYPGAASQGRPDLVVPPSGDYELIPLQTRDGTRIVVQFGWALDSRGQKMPDSRTQPTVIFFYGNGACLAYMGTEFDALRRLGANVLMVEFPGYGMSGGKPSEKGFYAAADAGYDHLMQRPEIDHGRIVAAGWSMGAAVALDLASRRKVSSLVLVNAFTTLPAVARALVRWFPTSLIIKSRFDNLAKIPSVTCPILIAHGTRDELVPPVMSGQLAAAARTKVTSYDVIGGGHNDVFEVGGPPLWEVIRASIFGLK
jgi:pimeloyl-ACP methyl ester carboxylesterase